MPILFLACTNVESVNNASVINFESGFSLFQDTISVNIKGEMTHALKYRDKFYVLFEQRVFKYGGYGKRSLYVFSNGQIEKVIDCPGEMETVYLDFYVKNDRIILKPYMDNQCYQLNMENYCWTKIDKTDDLIFEDDMFQVYSLDFGEWGGKTWFKDKKTGQEYVLEATTPLVNKIDKIYYLTNPFTVLKIENPLLLNKCSDDITYENIESTGKFYSWYGKPVGFDTVYQDTSFDYFDFEYKPHIVSSFVLNDELLHVYETDTAVYIARHGSRSIEPIQKITDNVKFYNWFYSYRCANLNGKNELLKFSTGEEQVFGLMEITGSEIHMSYIVNKALLEPKLTGTEKADSIFIDRLNTILSGLNNLELSRADLKEQSWGSFDITPNHNISIGNSCNPNNYTIDTCRSYLIVEDSVISNSIMYYASKESDLVRVVTIDWDYEEDFLNPDSEETVKKSFDSKVKFLTDYISQNIGKQTERTETKNYFEIGWKTQSGLMIKLTGNTKYYSTRLYIYKID